MKNMDKGLFALLVGTSMIFQPAVAEEAAVESVRSDNISSLEQIKSWFKAEPARIEELNTAYREQEAFYASVQERAKELFKPIAVDADDAKVEEINEKREELIKDIRRLPGDYATEIIEEHSTFWFFHKSPAFDELMIQLSMINASDESNSPLTEIEFPHDMDYVMGSLLAAEEKYGQCLTAPVSAELDAVYAEDEQRADEAAQGPRSVVNQAKRSVEEAESSAEQVRADRDQKAKDIEHLRDKIELAVTSYGSLKSASLDAEKRYGFAKSRAQDKLNKGEPSSASMIKMVRVKKSADEASAIRQGKEEQIGAMSASIIRHASELNKLNSELEVSENAVSEAKAELKKAKSELDIAEGKLQAVRDKRLAIRVCETGHPALANALDAFQSKAQAYSQGGHGELDLTDFDEAMDRIDMMEKASRAAVE